MTDNDLWSILAYWSYWDREPLPSVARSLPLPQPDPQLVLGIQGVRRAGKSTFLSQLLGRWGVERTQALFANFEDPRLTAELGPGLLFRIADLFRASREGALWFFFDEIQNVPDWEKWLHTCLERNRRDYFVVTGSNASLLAGELSTRLTGRHRLVELFPFDFFEAAQARPGLNPELFLEEGGFPKVVTSGGDLGLRQQYFRDIVERDIAHRVGARSNTPVLPVLQQVFESCGAELSLRRLAAACGVSVDTAGVYLRAAEDAYLLFACPFFSYSSRQEQVRNKKYYPIDPGLRRAVIPSSARDLGKSLECAAFLALRKRFGRVCYWRDHGEVDFVVLRDGRPWPVQVSWGGPQERHQRALDEFYAAFPQAHEAVFLSADDLADNFARLL